MQHEDVALLHVRVMTSLGGWWKPTGDALYLRNGIIERIGSAADLHALASSRNARVLDFADTPGAACFPAFMDAHLHLDLYGFSLQNVDLNGTTSMNAALERIRLAGRPDNGAWIHGDCWDDELWSHGPHRHQLDDLYPNSPVVLNRKDYHSLWLNTAALKAAGLWDARPFGLDLVPCDNDGPTGIVRDAAQDWVLSRIPAPQLEERFAALHSAISSLLSMGFASCCSMDYGILPELQALVPAMSDEPRIRIWQAIGIDNLDAAVSLGLRSGFGSDFLRLGGVKAFADGSLGSRTAYMEKPWPGEPYNHGYHTYESVDWLAGRFRKADENGLWIWTHAIGDRANEDVLDAFQQAGTAVSKGHAHHRIEHAQFLRPQDVERFADLGIAASVQPSHLDLDIGKLRTVFPTPHPRSYAFRSLLASGAELNFGSDAPVETPDALKGIAFAAFRTRSGELPYQSDQCISIQDALTAYTVAPQRSVGMAGQRGNLVEGQDADIVVLSRDILGDSDPQTVQSTRVLATIVAGDLAFKA
ncbi:MAG: amidohydrolase [Caldiserica bacterium]|nr:amidohydrolase [Caldisericota bacterium]